MLFFTKLMNWKIMCLRKLLILVINIVIIGCISRQRSSEGWEQITFRYGIWRKLPQYEKAAFDEGYVRLNDVCKTDFFHGFLFMKDNNTKTMPIYDLNGELMGIQTSIPGNMKGFNSQNQTIDLPPVEIFPPVVKTHMDKNGIQHYIVTAYFKHPSLLCNPFLQDGVRAGKGLYIQMGNNPVIHHQHIPLQSKHLTPMWMRGHCAPLMGTHYFMGLSPSMPCEKLHPLFLTYDMDGNLGAFGWVFQGRPNNFQSEEIFRLYPVTYPFLFNTSMLPSCMFHDQFQVFGVHIYLQDQNKLLCTKVDNLKPKKELESAVSSNRNQRISNVIMVDKMSSDDVITDDAISDKTKDEYNKDINSGETKVDKQNNSNGSSSLTCDVSLIVCLVALLCRKLVDLCR